MHILILGNDPKTLVNFNGPLIEAMLGAGHKVTAAGCGRDAGLERWFAERDVAYADAPHESLAERARRAAVNVAASLLNTAKIQQTAPASPD